MLKTYGCNVSIGVKVKAMVTVILKAKMQVKFCVNVKGSKFQGLRLKVRGAKFDGFRGFKVFRLSSFKVSSNKVSGFQGFRVSRLRTWQAKGLSF